MFRISVVFGVGILIVCPTAYSETEPGVIQPSTSFRTYIPHSLEVPAFTPPILSVPKQVPAIRMDSAVTVPSKSSRTLTILRGEASKLPDLPEPPAPNPSQAIPRERTPEEFARKVYHRRHTLRIGATIFDHRLSVVHWQHPDTGESYQAVCGFDIGLLAGVGRFVRDGETYDLMLSHSHYDTLRFRNLAAWGIPDLSEVPADSIIFTEGNQKDPLGTAPITLLKDLITTEKSRLILFQESRNRYHQASGAWQKAHPVPPRDETFWLRPHRGSRYLADPKPEATAR